LLVFNLQFFLLALSFNYDKAGFYLYQSGFAVIKQLSPAGYYGIFCFCVY